jgi:hypothetical protein
MRLATNLAAFLAGAWVMGKLRDWFDENGWTIG